VEKKHIAEKPQTKFRNIESVLITPFFWDYLVTMLRESETGREWGPEELKLKKNKNQ